MGDLAASGGYMIAAACDTIVAQPTTITGSIGVIAAKLSVQRWDLDVLVVHVVVVADVVAPPPLFPPQTHPFGMSECRNVGMLYRP